MSTTRRHYTFEDIESTIEDERAKFVIWRCEALRELRACLLATQRPAGAAMTWKTFKR
jgi:hypothetical protein